MEKGVEGEGEEGERKKRRFVLWAWWKCERYLASSVCVCVRLENKETQKKRV
jgi:hypothetical protein